MTYNTATLVDAAFILLSPVFIDKKYFWTVYLTLFLKLTVIAGITQHLIVIIGLIFIMAIGLISYVILMLFSNYIAQAEQLFLNTKEVEWYKSIAYKDELTGVYSKRYMNLELKSLDEERYQPIGIVMFDIDDYKLINDHYNHSVGDDVLRRIAHLVQEQLDFEDQIGRYGGDEFILILKNKSPQTMLQLVEAIRKCLEQFRVLVNQHHEVNVTATFGVYVILEEDNIRAADALKKADQLLIDAKQYGKNQIKTNLK